TPDCGLDVLFAAKVNGNALPLLAARGLDDNATMARAEVGTDRIARDRDLRGQLQPGALEQSIGQALVIAPAERHRRGEIAQRLPAADRAPAMRQPEQPGLRILNLDLNAAPSRLVDDDLCIDVKLRIFGRADIELLIDRIFPLD